MKKFVFSSILGLSLMALPMVAQTEHDDKAADEYKKSGKKMKSKSKEAGHELKEAKSPPRKRYREGYRQRCEARGKGYSGRSQGGR